jgi:hypothetical protein
MTVSSAINYFEYQRSSDMSLKTIHQSINVNIHLRKYSVFLELLFKYVAREPTTPSFVCPSRNSLITLIRYGLPVTLMYLTDDYNLQLSLPCSTQCVLSKLHDWYIKRANTVMLQM